MALPARVVAPANVGEAARMVGAIFGAASVSDSALVGQAQRLLDWAAPRRKSRSLG